jgi:hypothetical protein
MRTLVPLGLTLALAAGAYAQQDGRVHAGEQPPQPLRGDIHGFADPGPIRSFTQLCGKADAIVDGVVETDASRLMPGPGRALPIETDFRIAVSRVLKGSIDAPELVVSEKGGTVGELHLIMNFPLLERGERYILFLYADKRPGIPPVPGLSRYEAEIFYGTFKVGEGKIQPFFRSPLEGKYTGLTPEEFAVAIAAELKH